MRLLMTYEDLSVMFWRLMALECEHASDTFLKSGDYEDNDIDETQCHEGNGHPSEVIESGRSFT